MCLFNRIRQSCRRGLNLVVLSVPQKKRNDGVVDENDSEVQATGFAVFDSPYALQPRSPVRLSSIKQTLPSLPEQIDEETSYSPERAVLPDDNSNPTYRQIYPSLYTAPMRATDVNPIASPTNAAAQQPHTLGWGTANVPNDLNTGNRSDPQSFLDARFNKADEKSKHATAADLGWTATSGDGGNTPGSRVFSAIQRPFPLPDDVFLAPAPQQRSTVSIGSATASKSKPPPFNPFAKN
jgi:hypothetical protein